MGFKPENFINRIDIPFISFLIPCFSKKFPYAFASSPKTYLVILFLPNSLIEMLASIQISAGDLPVSLNQQLLS